MNIYPQNILHKTSKVPSSLETPGLLSRQKGFAKAKPFLGMMVEPNGHLLFIYKHCQNWGDPLRIKMISKKNTLDEHQMKIN